MNDYVIITINGTDYYCPSNMVQFITDDLINTSSSTITLYRDISNNNGYNYPYIRLSPFSVPILYNGNQNYSNLTVQSVSFNSLAHFYKEYDYVTLCLQIVILFAVWINLFLRRSR